MIFDPIYLLFVAPGAAALSVGELPDQVGVQQVLPGADRARPDRRPGGAAACSTRPGIRDVQVVRTQGILSDHYNPVTKTLALSEAVYGSPSVAAIGVACHEAGHALQHAEATSRCGCARRWCRRPTSARSSATSCMIARPDPLRPRNVVLLGAVLFSAVLLFQIVTLPVEFDASARAKRLAVEYGIVLEHEREGMDRVLNAAALTYVAAAVSTLMTLLYFLLRSGLLGGRRD